MLSNSVVHYPCIMHIHKHSSLKHSVLIKEDNIVMFNPDYSGYVQPISVPPRSGEGNLGELSETSRPSSSVPSPVCSLPRLGAGGSSNIVKTLVAPEIGQRVHQSAPEPSRGRMEDFKEILGLFRSGSLVLRTKVPGDDEENQGTT